ncbi:MAG: 1-acyl-sn-glycerol-3-phosphate acyltransferase [Saprospiraceae bacterium]|nr:1-acyl-sn-glycerol-3-phosphate acyltransferase [Saprospiraceae bacterium]
MFSKISAFILGLFGWKVELAFEKFPDKYIIAVVPHTSAWDFPIGVLTRSVMKQKIKYVAKASLFKFPLGGIMKLLGGVPVDRSKRNNFVDGVVDIFNERKQFAVCIAPEGTRKRVEKLKTGFYYMAKGAGIPILLCRFDYSIRRVQIAAPFYTTDDMEADFKYIEGYFRGIPGRYPEFSF